MWIKIVLVFLGISKSLAQNFEIFSEENLKIWEANPECQSSLEQIVDGVKKSELWALKILDASTKIPSGILSGHFTDFGNYDECFNPEGPVRTHYCFASILPPQEMINSTLGNDTELSSLALRWSYCIPESCPAKVLQNALRELLNVNVSVTDSDCDSNNPKPISKEDYLGISIWGIFIAIAVFSTIYDVVVGEGTGKKNKWLSSFSLYTNAKNLLKTEVSPETMLPLHGLRFLSICWVVLGHRYFFDASPTLINLTDFAKELSKIRSEFFIQGVLAVDTFFLLSGFLNSYNLLKVLDKLQRFPVWMYYIHRYIRLTPALAAIVLMYATWYPLIGDGPLWNQTTAMWKQLCVDNWWSTLLYINNYHNSVSQCAGQSWYLAVDMQLYWLSPFVILPLWKRPRLGKLLLWGLLVLSTISTFVVAFVYKFRMSLTFGLSFEELERVTKIIYVPTHTRATPYIIGVMIGHYMYNLKKTNTRLVMSKGYLYSGWLLSTLIGLSVFFGNFQFSRPLADHPYNVWESSVYIAFHRIGWGMSIGWIIVACLNKQGGIINDILSWKAFIPLSRLTYCIFLSHMAIQQYNIGSARSSDYFQYFHEIHKFFGDLFYSLLAALALSLIFESPVMVLEKLTTRKPQEKNLKGEVNNGFQDDPDGTNKTHEI